MRPIQTLTVLATSALAATPLGLAAVDYDLYQIPWPQEPGWDSLFPLALNDHGHATGINFAGFFQMPRGFYFDGRTSIEFAKDWVQTLPYESWTVGVRPLDINNDNHILFTLEVLDVGVFSYVWYGGDNFVQIQPAVPGSVGASGINNNGLIVGTYNTVICCPQNLENKGWIYDRTTGTTTIIEPLAPYTDSIAYKISDTGYVTGFLMGGPLVARGFVYKDGVMTLLGTVDADDYLSIGRDVNDAGFVAGFTTNFPPPGSPSLSRIMLWDNEGSVIQWAHPFGGPNGFDLGGINNNNEIVGTMVGPQQPVHFHNGVLRNLNNHFDQPVAGLTLDLWDAFDINNSGQIVAHGQFLGGTDWSHYGFILTPQSPCKLGDLDCSGSVGVPDLLILLSAWGQCPPAPEKCPADLTGDGSVGVPDLLVLLKNWG